jgi:hypothetical protein
MSIDKPELDAGRAVWNAIREIYAANPRMYINPEQAWEDLSRQSRTDCHLIAQAAIATVMSAGYSLADKKMGVKNDKTVK